MKRATLLVTAGLAAGVFLSCRSAAATSVPPPADPCAAADVAEKASQAMSLVQQKKYAEAEGPAKQALAACAGQALAAQALGNALVAQKKHDEALDRMSAVIKAKPDVAYAYFWRGQAYYAKQMPDKMVSDFETFLKLAPKAPEAASVQQLLAGLKH